MNKLILNPDSYRDEFRLSKIEVFYFIIRRSVFDVRYFTFVEAGLFQERFAAVNP
jgi:hypothetical protein